MKENTWSLVVSIKEVKRKRIKEEEPFDSGWLDTRRWK
jgi:hypothetical protein